MWVESVTQTNWNVCYTCSYLLDRIMRSRAEGHHGQRQWYLKMAVIHRSSKNPTVQNLSAYQGTRVPGKHDQKTTKKRNNTCPGVVPTRKSQ